MREVTRPVFVAFDNSEFSTAASCREYERGKAPERLVGLTPEQVQADLDRREPAETRS